MVDGLALPPTIMRALGAPTPEVELIERLCRSAVDLGHYDAAWVDFRGEGPEHPIVAVAGCRWDRDGLADLDRSWRSGNPSQGPVGRALLSGEMQVVHDVAQVPGRPPWKGHCEASGYRSLVVLPFRTVPTGALTVASRVAGRFDPASIEPLATLADTVGLAAQSLQRLTRVTQSLEETVDALCAALEKRDPYTAGHQRRVAELAQGIALRLGMSASDAYGVAVAGRVHDIGKLVVPLEILTKPARLTANEFALVRDHSRAGADILAGVAFPWPVARMVLEVHERLDGSGYPSGMSGSAILPGARILAVADVVEAMAAHRPYRASLGLQSALDHVRQWRGTLFDADVVDACLELCQSDELHFEPDARRPFGLLPTPR